jgi:hypothetical protein
MPYRGIKMRFMSVRLGLQVSFSFFDRAPLASKSSRSFSYPDQGTKANGYLGCDKYFSLPLPSKLDLLAGQLSESR